MKTDYIDGAISLQGKMSETAYYDMGNRRITAQFDGRGNISGYAVMNKFEIFDCFYSMFSINGKPLSYNEDKTVVMYGCMQSIQIYTEDADIYVEQFLAREANAIFFDVTVSAKEALIFSDVINFGANYTSYLKEFFNSRFSLKTIFQASTGLLKKGKFDDPNNVIRNTASGDFYIDFAANVPLRRLEGGRLECNQFSLEESCGKGETIKIRLVVSGGTRKDFSYFDVATGIRDFDEYRKQADEYLAQLEYKGVGATPFEKAYYASCLNVVLANYKELGKFKGFLAGITYQFPARTYFRDGYWTTLPLLKRQPDLVRNEILTLARGIGKRGECASAVKYNFKNYWGDHYDSPSFFTLMIYDYVVQTRDFSILEEKVKGKSVLSLAKKALDLLRTKTDETGLLVKEGKYNRRDWCDNVFRTGYCTYDEALFARALMAMGELLSLTKKDEGKVYNDEYKRVVKSINDLLWSDKKGYFVNYLDKDGFVEDNLSVDTILIPLFGLTDNFRANSVLEEAESLLESRNNKEQPGGDFGILSVFPFYSEAKATVQKSSLPLYYHNGGDWPYWSAAYAYALLAAGKDCSYPLFRWYQYNLDKGNYTPIEFFSPCHKGGSLLQAWSGLGAFVMDNSDGQFFDKRI